MKKTKIDLLQILKKEGGCKTNQELLNLLESMADDLRKKVSRAVYLTDTKYRIKQGNERFKDTIPEIDYIK